MAQTHSRHICKTRQRDLWATVLVLLVCFGWFVFGLERIHMRPDEHLVYIHTSGSLMDTVQYQARQDVQAPLWHSFFWAWRQLTGETEFAARYQGVLFSTLALALLMRLLRAWFWEVRFGWFAALVLSVNALFFTYAFEVRPYPLVLLVATVCMWFYWRWLHDPTPRRAVFYGLSLALLAYVHYFLAFLVVVQGVYLLAQRPARARWMQLGGAVLLAGIVWLPWAPTFVYQVNLLREIDGGSLGIASTTYDTTLPGVMRLLRRTTNQMPLLWAGVLLVGAVMVRRREYALLLLWGLGVPAVALLVNRFANVYDQRYVVYLVLGIGGAAGVALASLPRGWARWLALGVFLALNVWQLPNQLPDRVPYRSIMQRMSNNHQPGDVLLFDNAKEDTGFVRWHLEQYMVPDLLANRVATVDEAADHRRVWFVSGDVRDPNTRARFRELEATHPQVLVTGRCEDECFIARLLEGAPQQTPATVFMAGELGDALPYYGADVDSAAGGGVQVRLWWMVDVPLKRDYSVSVRLVDGDGAVVAAQDGPPTSQDGEVQRTSQMEAGRMVTDWRQLQAPAGTYSLQLVVYEPIGGDVLPANGAEAFQGGTITVP